MLFVIAGLLLILVLASDTGRAILGALLLGLLWLIGMALLLGIIQDAQDKMRRPAVPPAPLTIISSEPLP